MGKILVAYFSAGGNTALVARNLAEAAKADVFEIRPKELYTREDLDYMNPKSRSSIEMHDMSYRPETDGKDANIKAYDTIFLGFPIWWYVAPNIINTFLESYDFSGKKIILFITSGGSGFGKTVEGLKKSVAEDTEIIEGRILNSKPSVSELKEWVKTI